MDMSVGRLAEARGERRTRVQGVVIAGSVAGACMIAVPAGLLDLLFSSIGLSEFVPVLAPPVGWPVRIVLALLVAAIAAVLSGAAANQGVRPGGKRNAIMGWTQSLGLHHLARLARGEAAVAVDHRVTITPDMRAPRMRRSPQEKVQETLARRRADLHPDAPPRAPLMASRDLPVVAELTVVESLSESVAAPEPLPRIATPIRDTTDQDRPRPLPRAPEPLSDSDLNWVRDLVNSRDDKVEAFAPRAATPLPTAPLSDLMPERPVGESIADDSLQSLLGRFEQGVAHRIALRDAADAQARIEDSIAGPAAPAEGPVAAPAPVAVPAEGMEMDMALNAALETLRKLSAKANGR